MEENKDHKCAITERKDQNAFMKRNWESKSRQEKKEKPSKKPIPKPERNIRKSFLH